MAGTRLSGAGAAARLCVRDGAPFFTLVAENRQRQRIVAQKHARAFSAALLVSAGQRAEDAIPRLPRLVPRADTLPFVQGVLQFAIEIETVNTFLVKKLSAAVSQKLVNANLELESIRFPLLEQFTIGFAIARMRQTKARENKYPKKTNLTKVIFSLALFADNTLPSDTFLNPTFWRMSS
jgi:hypothetical protein